MPSPGPTSGAKRLTALVVVLVLVALDQWSKFAIFAWLPEAAGLVRDSHGHLRYPLVGSWLTLMESYNRGAAFGRFGDFPHLLVGGRVIAVFVLAWMLFSPRRLGGWVRAALILVLAGAIGNLLDNLGLGGVEEGHPYGTVRDFIDVYFSVWDWHFPTFNVADSCISVGAVLWILSGLFHGAPSEDEAEAAPPAEA